MFPSTLSRIGPGRYVFVTNRQIVSYDDIPILVSNALTPKLPFLWFSPKSPKRVESRLGIRPSAFSSIARIYITWICNLPLFLLLVRHLLDVSLYPFFKMPKLISLTPRWLTRPSAGAEAFAAVPDKQPSHLRQQSLVDEIYPQPHKALAHRGTEVFVVVGNEIRWLNLRRLKHDGESKQTQSESRKPAYRVRHVPRVAFSY